MVIYLMPAFPEYAMQDPNEYNRVLQYLNQKSLILHDTTDFHPVLYFYFIDTLAHIDYTLSVLSYNFQSIRNEMSREYLRWRIDEEKKGDRAYFPAFINWLKEFHPQKFELLPVVWSLVYDEASEASYRSFRLVIDPDSNVPPTSAFFFMAIDEFYDQEFLKSLYNGASLSQLLEEFLRERKG